MNDTVDLRKINLRPKGGIQTDGPVITVAIEAFITPVTSVMTGVSNVLSNDEVTITIADGELTPFDPEMDKRFILLARPYSYYDHTELDIYYDAKYEDIFIMPAIKQFSFNGSLGFTVKGRAILTRRDNSDYQKVLTSTIVTKEYGSKEARKQFTPLVTINAETQAQEKNVTPPTKFNQALVNLPGINDSFAKAYIKKDPQSVQTTRGIHLITLASLTAILGKHISLEHYDFIPFDIGDYRLAYSGKFETDTLVIPLSF